MFSTQIKHALHDLRQTIGNGEEKETDQNLILHALRYWKTFVNKEQNHEKEWDEKWDEYRKKKNLIHNERTRRNRRKSIGF